MRVLMLSWEYPPNVAGGLGQHVADLIPRLADEGIEVHLVTPLLKGGLQTEVLAGAFIHRVPIAGEQIGAILSFAQYVNEALYQAALDIVRQYGPFDVIHNHDWLTSFAAHRLKVHPIRGKFQ